MSSIPDDKSAPKEYCKNEGAHDPAEPDGHINLSAPNEEPVSHLDGAKGRMYSIQTSSPASDNPDNKKISKLRMGTATATATALQRSNCPLRIPPRRLAFCGGGVRCVGHVGVMKALDEANLLDCVKEVIGISGGALFALAAVLGYSVTQMERLAVEFDFTVLGILDPEDFLTFPLTFGLNSGEAVEKLIGSILRQKGFSPDITFAEMAVNKKTRFRFRCYASELQTSSVKELSVGKTPNMMVRTAVRASMSLPVLYTPVKEGDSLLVDGGLLHNLPLVFLTEEEIAETWAVLFTSGKAVSVKPLDGLMDFLTSIYNGMLSMRNIPYIEKYKDRIILIKNEFDALSFEESSEGRAKFIEVCRKSGWAFLEGTRAPARRFSAA
jgi:predicted acylesterase/phospholipase RssA